MFIKVLLVFLTCTVAALCEDARTAVKGNPRQEYFLMDQSAGVVPPKGYKLLLVLPGGNGSADFNPFVSNLAANSAGKDYLVAQLISIKWTPDQSIIWPTKENEVEGMKFSTEDYIHAVFGEIAKTRKVDPEHVYLLAWSSGGPAIYAASLELKEIKGAFVAMSVFKPDELPSLSAAKGRRYYIYHSPEDAVCPMRMAEDAKVQLAKKKAAVELVSYPGGHGWHDNPVAAVAKGMRWLEQR